MVEREERQTFLDVVANNEELKPFVYKHYWVSGSSTMVYPYALWDCDSHPQVEVQLLVDMKGKYPNYKFYAKDERALTKIAQAIKDANEIVKDFYLKTNDGSCPPELVFELK